MEGEGYTLTEQDHALGLEVPLAVLERSGLWDPAWEVVHPATVPAGLREVLRRQGLGVQAILDDPWPREFAYAEAVTPDQPVPVRRRLWACTVVRFTMGYSIQVWLRGPEGACPHPPPREVRPAIGWNIRRRGLDWLWTPMQ